MRRRELITLVGGAAAALSIFWSLTAYTQQHDWERDLQSRILRLRAGIMAANVSWFIMEIERDLHRTMQLSWTAEALDQRRFDVVQVLRQAPAITQIALLDPAGKERLRLSRLSVDLPIVDPRTVRQRPPPTSMPTSTAFGGIGIEVTMQDGLVKVVRPIEGMPAARAGVLPNDVIAKLDDEPVHGLTLNQAVLKMRGPADTTIKLTIIRAGEDKPLEISVTRAVIQASPRVNRDDAAGANPSVSGEPAAPDMSKEPQFTVAMAKKVYYAPVYFLRQSEPHLTLALAGTQPEFGVSVAEINLKLISDLIGTLKVGNRGVAYLVDSAGRVIAHSDSSLVQRDFSNLTHVQAARAAGTTASPEAVPFTKDIHGGDVLAIHAVIPMLDWLVVLELPTDEINAPTP
jgi:hypothetical protein